MKLLVLAIDGLDYRFLRSWRYPALSSWRDGARWGVLWSAEKRTGPSWTTIMTGWTTGHHGVNTLFGVKVNPNPDPKKRPPWGHVPSTTFAQRPRDYLFDEAWRAGLKAAAVNMPGMPTPRPPGEGPARDRGFLVGGWPYRPWGSPESVVIPEDYYTGEADASRRCEQVLAIKPPGAGMGWEIHAWPFQSWAAWIDEQDGYKIDLAKRWADETGGLDLLMICTQMWDRGAHMLCSKSQGEGIGAYDPRLLEILGPILDRWVDKAISTFDPEEVAICSDHGFGDRGHTYTGVWGINHAGLSPFERGSIPTIDQADFAPTMLGRLGIDAGFGRPIRRDGFDRLAEPKARIPEELAQPIEEDLDEDEMMQRRTLAALGYIEGEY